MKSAWEYPKVTPRLFGFIAFLSAAQGNAVAQCSLGWMYENGLGVRQNYAEAERLYRLAADQGNALAEGNLRWMLTQVCDLANQSVD
jgi:TPR repeat protein